jgi:hypothetical protein
MGEKPHATRKHPDHEAARCCFVQALAAGLRALRDPECMRLLGPVAPGAMMPGGARVPGTSFELDPVQAAFSIGTMVCWHGAAAADPCESLGGILSVADYLARKAIMEGRAPPTVRDVLAALIQAHEIERWLAAQMEGAAFDHTVRVRIAGAAVVTGMLGGSREQIASAVCNAWLDGVVLAVHRHAPCAGTRARWAAADATSRAVRHALMALRGALDSVAARYLPGSCEGLMGGYLLGVPASFAPGGGVGLPQERGLQLARLELEDAVDERFLPRQAERIKALFAQRASALDALPVNELMAELVTHAAREEPLGKERRVKQLPLHLPEGS